MLNTKLSRLLQLFLLLCTISIYAMENFYKGEKTSIAMDESDYDSDSEDEEEYVYSGLPNLCFDTERDKEYFVLSRGIHFSPSKFDKEQRSNLKKRDLTLQPIYSSAAYDLAKKELTDFENLESVGKYAEVIKKLISDLSPEERNKFQELYSNEYDGFHDQLGNENDKTFKKFTSKKNPQISTSEGLWHSGKYAAGLKSLGKKVGHLLPKYDESGKPKHPYLGKIFVILVEAAESEKKLDPYFVIYGYANRHIKVNNRPSKNILAEREVSFSGFIPGKCVVFSKNIRVPSLEKYKKYYEEKYGISEKSFETHKKNIANFAKFRDFKKTGSGQAFIEKIVEVGGKKLQSHIEESCKKKGITLVYKGLDGKSASELASTKEATEWRSKNL